MYVVSVNGLVNGGGGGVGVLNGVYVCVNGGGGGGAVRGRWTLTPRG